MSKTPVPPFRLLIVDDQPLTRQSLRDFLTAEFCLLEVREAGDGREALECLETFLPDLILMDGRMPRMDGICATQQIKQKYPQIQIILLSIYKAYQVAALASGADGYVAKEEPLDLLREIIQLRSEPG